MLPWFGKKGVLTLYEWKRENFFELASKYI